MGKKKKHFHAIMRQNQETFEPFYDNMTHSFYSLS